MRALSPALGLDFIRTALVAKTNITVSGNVLVDSFNSSDPNYSTDGNYDPAKRKDGGNVVLTENFTNAAITLTEAFTQSIVIYGKVFLGAESQVVQLGNPPAIGSINWIDAGNTGIQPAWLVRHPGGYLPDAPMPPNGGLVIPVKTTYVLMGSNYPNSYLLTSGNYQQSSVSLTSTEKILVSGHVKLYCSNNLRMSGQSQIIIATNSSLTVYAGTGVDLSGGGIVNYTRLASNLTFYGLNTCTNIQYTGGGDLIGTFYAPTAAFRMSGGGSTFYNFVGGVVANSIAINGKYEIHYDEALLPWPVFLNPAATLASSALTPNGTIQFEVTGLPGFSYIVQTSTNLTDWLPVATNTSPFTFTNSGPLSPQQFFRATYLLQPPWVPQ